MLWCSEIFTMHHLLPLHGVPRNTHSLSLPPGVLSWRVRVRLGVPEVFWLSLSPPLHLWVVVPRVAGAVVAMVTILIAREGTSLPVLVHGLWRRLCM